MTWQDRYPLSFRLYPYTRSPDQDAGQTVRHSVTIVGGGPVGVATALDLALRGIPALVLDDHEGVGQGSRAICFAKRTLEIAHRLGCGAAMRDKGVIWNRGRVFHDRDEVYSFDLLPEDGHRYPAFINLQQPWFERFMVEAVDRAKAQGAPIEIRGRNRVTGMEATADGVTLAIDTPDGPYTLTTDWLIACDGAKSATRDRLGLDFDGRVFEDNFLIADVKMSADFPTERWFWFEPWFKSGASALLHKQPDDIWRIDFQLGWDIDRKTELDPARIRKRIDLMLGPDVEYDLDWTSIYTFQCRRMDRFRHGRVIFAGDAAHQVSPFGARGANSGLQDADNLGWKLAAVLKGDAPETLLDSYDTERIHAADENIRNSTRSTDFITPKTPQSRIFRDAVLHLARHAPFARPMVNSGRLSVPATYDGSPLNTQDALPGGPARTRPGAPCPDARLADGSYLLDHLKGPGFTLLVLGATPPRLPTGLPVLTLETAANPQLRARYLGEAERALYLIRPDQHVAARWAACDAGKLARALDRAQGKAP
ncbi:FAD-dependent oxidoreductase [Roseicyclus mahoneyensis]|uniref:3-(3-hydroxy-phenyl)propionate hydroxylase n=1 Tax=Roseicyclus mahoneyensis TaxID=164332 RepID=A0A316G9S3_9RHOB|nr:FAD-dependent oxidoreductase [Roseicyclus mahoneyensis]PWK57333.1 3-(3-hydroxy-phenyl)propionate hydroxylase [Roseicyclus mahoneyensis]